MEERKHLESLLLEQNGVIVLDDQELGEIDLVTHTIGLGNVSDYRDSWSTIMIMLVLFTIMIAVGNLNRYIRTVPTKSHV